jgi:hypothetical protein
VSQRASLAVLAGTDSTGSLPNCPETRTDVDSVSFVVGSLHRDIKGHNLAANVCLFVNRKLDGNLAETAVANTENHSTSLNWLPSFSL